MARPDAQIDLAQAALVLVEPLQPGLDIAAALGELDRIGAEAERRLLRRTAGDPGARLAALLDLLFDELRFTGNVTDYYDPRNSYLNLVLERRLGIPITLALVLMEVARRAGLAADGVGFPGHFLVRVELGGGLGPRLIDPFRGRVLDEQGLAALHAQVSGALARPDPRLLAPVGKRSILERMLQNLRKIFRDRGEVASLRVVLDRLAVLRPGDDQIAAALASLDRNTGPAGGRN